MMKRPGDNIPLEIHPDGTVLAFTAAVSVLTGILFGLAPAFRATRVDIATALKENARTTSSRLSLGNALVAGQVAVSLLLLVAAGLFIRTLLNLQRVDFGFDSSRVLMFGLDARRDGGPNEGAAQFYRRLLGELETLPGVETATASQLPLMTGWVNTRDIVTDGPPVRSNEAMVYWNGVGPEFCRTLQIPVVLGREIGWPEFDNGRKAAVVNEALARHFFPGQNPLGHHFNFGNQRDAAEQYEIICVVADARYDTVRGEPPRTAYIPYSAFGELGRLQFELRTSGAVTPLIPAVRARIQKMDPDLAMMNVKTIGDQIRESLYQEFLFARLTTFFGFVALVLVAVGLFGTLAYTVTRRTNEIGIRMALGAQRGEVLWMILRQSLLLVGGGVSVSLPGALAANKLIESSLYGVKATDPFMLAAGSAVLVGAGALAGYLPARSASRVDPTIALRHE